MVLMCNVVRDNLRSDESTELSARGLSGVSEGKVLANDSLLGVLESDGREGLDVEVGAFRARGDELSSEGENGTGTESNIEGSWDGLGASSVTDESLVTGLNSDDGTSSCEDIGGGDKRSGSEVSGDTNSLKDTGSLDHGVGAGESSVEVVLTGLDGLSTCGGNDANESGDVSGLSLANLLESLDISLAEAECGEVCQLESLETLPVELRLEVLSSKGAV
jgi:hypothetical protein